MAAVQSLVVSNWSARSRTQRRSRSAAEFGSLLGCDALYGHGRWRKRKGVGTVRFEDGSAARAEIHWYEAFGVGRREFKIKRILE